MLAEAIEKRYISRLPLLLGAVLLLVTSAALGLAVYLHRPDANSGPRIAEGAFVVVFEVTPCVVCDKFRDGIGRPYQRTETAAKTPLRYFDVTDGPPPKRYRLKGEVYTFPTVVVFDAYGREMDRTNGAPTNAEVLERMAGKASRRAEREVARQSL